MAGNVSVATSTVGQNVVCPHCGHVHEVTKQVVLDATEGNGWVQCCGCLKVFNCVDSKRRPTEWRHFHFAYGHGACRDCS